HPQSVLKARLVILEGGQALRLWIKQVEQVMEPQLADADLQLLGSFQAGDIFPQNIRQVRLQPVNVPDADQAGSEKRQPNHQRGHRQAKEQPAIHRVCPQGAKCGRNSKGPCFFRSSSRIWRSDSPCSTSLSRAARMELGMPQPLGLQLASV